MSYEDLTDVINSMDDETVEQVLTLFAGLELTVIRPPCSGLVMFTVKDGFETDFHIGEVLVTEARVMFKGCEGFGMVLGESPRRALAKAASDALLRCPETTGICENLQAYLKQQKSLRTKKLMESSLLIAATKVNFDLMPGA